jgi:hypothetical protein
MLMSRLKGSLLLFTLSGCVHRSPDAAVLAPIVAYLIQEPVDQSKQPEYLIFGDELTASVLKSLRHDSRYRVLPIGKPFVCPSDRPECPRPYQLSVGVNQRMGDSAIATIRRIVFNDGGHAIALSEMFLLVRQNRKWRIEKVLSGSAIPMN